MDDLNDPIAVVGYSLKFPGDADSPRSFWQMLLEGRCASTDFPHNRLNVEAHYDRESTGARTVSTMVCDPSKTSIDAKQLPLRGGHFLKEDLSAFDPNFFNITPAEAKAMDPQHRIMLEISYRALENGKYYLSEEFLERTLTCHSRYNSAKVLWELHVRLHRDLHQRLPGHSCSGS